MFVWIFHRVSGLLLILLLGFQLFTGFYQASALGSPLAKAFADLHRHLLLNGLLVFLFIFHSLYGIRTILLDLGSRREGLLFWLSTLLGLLLFALFLALFFKVVAG